MSGVIELTIKTPDGEVKTRRVKGLFFVAQNPDDDNTSCAGVVGSTMDLLQTFQMVPKILKERTDEVLGNIKDKLNNSLQGLSSIIKPQEAISGTPLPRQKIVN